MCRKNRRFLLLGKVKLPWGVHICEAKCIYGEATFLIMEQINYDIDDFMNYCDVKQLSKETLKNYEQTLRLFAIFLKEELGVKETDLSKLTKEAEYYF